MAAVTHEGKVDAIEPFQRRETSKRNAPLPTDIEQQIRDIQSQKRAAGKSESENYVSDSSVGISRNERDREKKSNT